MERHVVDRVLLSCEGGVHAALDHDRFLRIRCTERGCRDCQDAKAAGYRSYHVWDLQNKNRQWTEFEPAPRRVARKD